MKNIVAIYTAQALVEPLNRLFAENTNSVCLRNIVDDSLIHEVIEAGKVTKSVTRRLLHYFMAADDMRPDLILNTCSSVGEVADMAREFISTPILKIDQPMAEEAVRLSKSIGVLATLPTTLYPTIRLLEKQAASVGKTVKIVYGLAEGAFEALVRGDLDTHDRRVLETSRMMANNAEILVLAQGSLGRMQRKLAKETGKTVLASPELCIEKILTLLGLSQ